MRAIGIVLLVVGCNHSTALPLPEDGRPSSSTNGIYQPTPFPHVDANGIQGNWIHVTPRKVTTMLWTFRPDGSFEMDVFEADNGDPFQTVPGSYRIDGNQLVLEGPFAGKPHVRMTEELLFDGDQVAAPVLHDQGDGLWEGVEHIDELDGLGQITASYDRTDRYLFDGTHVNVSVSVEDGALNVLGSSGGFAVIADAQQLDATDWDLSLPSVPSWNQLALLGNGSGMAAPPMTRTY